jgi:hypothetical protein
MGRAKRLRGLPPKEAAGTAGCCLVRFLLERGGNEEEPLAHE